MNAVTECPNCCGSTDPAVRPVIDEGDPNWEQPCPDPWHSAAVPDTRPALDEVVAQVIREQAESVDPEIQRVTDAQRNAFRAGVEALAAALSSSPVGQDQTERNNP